MAIINTRLRNTVANIVYAPTNQTKVITTMYLCNNSGNVSTTNIYLVPPQANVADPLSTMIYSNLAIAPGDTYIVNGERIILENGDSLQANLTSGASGSIVMTVSSIGT